MGLILTARPKLKRIPVLVDELRLGMVCVLLSAEENGADELIRRWRATGIDFQHVPFRVALGQRTDGPEVQRRPMMTREETQHVRDAADIAAFAVNNGTNVLAHCAAGKHRTGTFGYAVLRRLGYDREESIRRLGLIRPEIVGEFGVLPFIDWAEEVLV